MLISITEQCRMGCSHCMDNATPEGNHMTMDTFKKAVDFFNKYGSLAFIITGGEPTENPEWLDMVKYAMEHTATLFGSIVILTTNGMNISGNPDIQEKLTRLLKMGSKLEIQVTSVEKYYPIKVDLSEKFFKQAGVSIAREIEDMYPLGRARDNNYPWDSKCSKCFNIRSATRVTKNLQQSTLLLGAKGKFCTPRINWNGDIKLGESRICPTVATIYDSNEVIINNICNFHCGICAEVNKQLTKTQLAAIGE